MPKPHITITWGDNGEANINMDSLNQLTNAQLLGGLAALMHATIDTTQKPADIDKARAYLWTAFIATFKETTK